MTTLEIFGDSAWQMTLGERAAMEGVLAERRPRLALEIGTAEPGSLRRLGKHAEEVHSFNLATDKALVDEMANVAFHTGDPHQVLSETLARFAEESRNVDFALIDAGNFADGVRHLVDALLSSRAVADSLILIRDSANERVRAGLDAVPYAAYPKVAHLNLDFVPGYMCREPRRLHQLWGGLGLVIVDAKRTAYFPEVPVVEGRYYEAGHLYPQLRDMVIAGERAERLPAAKTRHVVEELAAVREEREHYKQLSDSVIGSFSWRITAPLRAARRKARGATRTPHNGL